MIPSSVRSDSAALAKRFTAARPFRHVVMDNFLDPAFAAELLAQFPAFERGDALNEAGKPGLKSTVERMRVLGGAYETLDDMVRSAAFLELIGRITSIPNLLYDPHYFGGGTHENRSGQDLDPHIDFNRHPLEPWHRRLNLIVYLNREWQAEWGGNLELHSDPRADDDSVTSIAPLLNRCVIFETNEYSWHGFARIALPPARSELSRKSIALYFYTRERPPEELAAPHSTIYVNRPLPEYFRPGLTLDAEHIETLRVLLARRDQHNERLYRDLTTLESRLESANEALRGSRLRRLFYFGRRALAALRR
ncbi:MAG: 2OG-Fe(II) oxygenase [Lysobacterales bacterium]